MSNKRQKVETGRVLVPKELSLYSLEELGSQSPGTPFGNRIVGVQASPDQACVYMAAGQRVHVVRVELGKGDAGAGKEDVLLPRRSQLKFPTKHCPALCAQAEIQSLSLAQLNQGQRTALVSMDARGRGLMSVASSSSLASGAGLPDASGEQPQHSSLRKGGSSQNGEWHCVGSSDSNISANDSSALGSAVPTFVLTPPGRVEAGWSGACMHEIPSSGGEVATTTACHFGQCLNFYQGDRLIRAVHTLHPPSALVLLPRGEWGQGGLEDVVACAEGHQVSLWDVRQGSRGGLIQRTSIAPGGSPVFDLAWCRAQGGLLGAAGAERAVTMLEPRKGFGIVHKWSGCAKYTIHHLGFSDVDPHWAYVAGLDSEVVCGRWDGGGATCSGNSNSSTGGHGRAAGPVKKRESKENEEDAAAHPKAGTGSIKFRGPARWSGMSLMAKSAFRGEGAEHDLVAAATQTHHMFLLDVAAQ